MTKNAIVNVVCIALGMVIGFFAIAGVVTIQKEVAHKQAVEEQMNNAHEYLQHNNNRTPVQYSTVIIEKIER